MRHLATLAPALLVVCLITVYMFLAPIDNEMWRSLTVLKHDRHLHGVLDDIVQTCHSILGGVSGVIRLGERISIGLEHIVNRSDSLILILEQSVNETAAQLPKITHNVNKSLLSFQGAMRWIMFSCVLCLLMSCCCTCLSLYGNYQHLYGVKKVKVTNFERNQEEEPLENASADAEPDAEPV